MYNQGEKLVCITNKNEGKYWFKANPSRLCRVGVVEFLLWLESIWDYVDKNEIMLWCNKGLFLGK